MEVWATTCGKHQDFYSSCCLVRNNANRDFLREWRSCFHDSFFDFFLLFKNTEKGRECNYTEIWLRIIAIQSIPRGQKRPWRAAYLTQNRNAECVWVFYKSQVSPRQGLYSEWFFPLKTRWDSVVIWTEILTWCCRKCVHVWLLKAFKSFYVVLQVHSHLLEIVNLFGSQSSELCNL